MKKVLFIIAHEGYQPVEYSASKKILENGDVKVMTASNKEGVATSSINQQKADVDLSLEKVNAGDYDGIFFIGGPGAPDHLDNEESYRIIREAAASGKPWGAICISPRILAKAGVLSGKKATGWDGDNELGKILHDTGAEYAREPVVVDGNLITASGPSAAEEWGRKILEKL